MYIYIYIHTHSCAPSLDTQSRLTKAAEPTNPPILLQALHPQCFCFYSTHRCIAQNLGVAAQDGLATQRGTRILAWQHKMASHVPDSKNMNSPISGSGHSQIHQRIVCLRFGVSVEGQL